MTNELKIKNESEKISGLNSIQKNRVLHLPKKSYGPFCLKIMSDFIEHHNLSKDLLMPMPGLVLEESLSRIFDVMLHSMGEDKRLQALKELDEYIASLPPPPKTSCIPKILLPF